MYTKKDALFPRLLLTNALAALRIYFFSHRFLISDRNIELFFFYFFFYLHSIFLFVIMGTAGIACG